MRFQEMNDMLTIAAACVLVGMYFLIRRYRQRRRVIDANNFAANLEPGTTLEDEDIPEFFDCDTNKKLYRGKTVTERHYEFQDEEYPKIRTRNGVVQEVDY